MFAANNPIGGSDPSGLCGVRVPLSNFVAFAPDITIDFWCGKHEERGRPDWADEAWWDRMNGTAAAEQGCNGQAVNSYCVPDAASEPFVPTGNPIMDTGKRLFPLERAQSWLRCGATTALFELNVFASGETLAAFGGVAAGAVALAGAGSGFELFGAVETIGIGAYEYGKAIVPYTPLKAVVQGIDWGTNGFSTLSSIVPVFGIPDAFENASNSCAVAFSK